MLLEHQGKRPHIHETAYIAPTATVCGDVTIGAESHVLFGAGLVAEAGPVTIGGRFLTTHHSPRGGAPPPSRMPPARTPGPPVPTATTTFSATITSSQDLRS